MKKPTQKRDMLAHVWNVLDTKFKPPTLEVGSFITSGKKDKRAHIPGEYVGIDIRMGNGVDLLFDITKGVPARNYFNTVICTDTFEHVDKPWLAAKNIEASMKPKAKIYFSIPFSWRYHKHPKDYWRMTPDAIRVLFKHIKWTKTFFMDRENTIYQQENPNIKLKKLNVSNHGNLFLSQKTPIVMPITILHMLGRKK